MFKLDSEKEGALELQAFFWMLECSSGFQKVSLCFIDYSKSFDCFNHEKLWVALKGMDVPQLLIILTCNLHCGQQATVRTEYGQTEQFLIGKGVR